MDFLGVGPLELFFILVIALIVLGPKDMVKAGRTLGRFMRKIVTSPNWRLLQETSREIRYLPNRLIREAGIEELQKEMPNPQQIGQEFGLEQLKTSAADLNKDLSAWTTPPTIGTPDASEPADPASSQENPAASTEQN